MMSNDVTRQHHLFLVSKVRLKHGQGGPLVDSPLISEVHGEECMWSLHPGRYVQVSRELLSNYGGEKFYWNFLVN